MLTMLIISMVLLPFSNCFEVFAADTTLEVSISSSAEATVPNPYAGKYKGAFSGSSKGTINAMIDSNGSFIATLYYTREKLSVDITGTADDKGNINCTTDSGEYKGKFTKPGRCSGCWKFGKMKGTWWTKKIK